MTQPGLTIASETSTKQLLHASITTSLKIAMTSPKSPNTSSDPRNDHDGDADEALAVPSPSSSVTYDHESWATFQYRVFSLAQLIWPEDNPDDFLVERMRGGSYNQVVGLARAIRDGADPSNAAKYVGYVIRIPRWDPENRLEQNAAALRFLGHAYQMPVAIPEVIRVDTTDDNPLGFPYMLQTRIPGVSLHSILRQLDHQALCKLAKELGHFHRALLATGCYPAGRFMAPPDQADIGQKLSVAPFVPEYQKTGTQPLRLPPASLTSDTITIDFLQELFTARHQEVEAAGDKWEFEIWERFGKIALRIQETGMFNLGWFSLCHLDFAPRNILVSPNPQPSENSTSSLICGVVDWDDAVIAPKFMSCYPPVWLWEDIDAANVSRDGLWDEPEDNDQPRRKLSV